MMQMMTLWHTSTAHIWGHCAENVRLWLERAGIAPWPEEQSDNQG